MGMYVFEIEIEIEIEAGNVGEIERRNAFGLRCLTERLFVFSGMVGLQDGER